MLLRHSAPRLGTQFVRCEGRHVRALNLVDHNQALTVVRRYCKCGATPCAKGRIGYRYRELDVLRIVVATSDYTHVFEAAGNDELVVSEEAEISCAEKNALRRPRQSASKSGFG